MPLKIQISIKMDENSVSKKIQICKKREMQALVQI